MDGTKRRLAVLLVLLLLSIVVVTATAEEKYDYSGETLKYQFGWKGFIAAEMVVSIVETDFKGVKSYKTVMDIKSLPKLDWIWKVRDKMTVYSDKKTLLPEYYKFKQREGKFSLDTEIEHDRVDKVLRSNRTRHENGKDKQYKRKWVSSGATYDPVSALLFLRDQDIQVGKVYTAKVFDGRRSHEISYTIEAKEIIDTALGKFETFRVTPRLVRSDDKPDSEDKTEKVRTVTTWVTTSPDHTVVLVKSKIFVGSVYAELIDYSGPMLKTIDQARK